MVQVAEYRLHGNVESMAAVQLAQSKRESLLLSFKDAKVRQVASWLWIDNHTHCPTHLQLSVVEWDPEVNDLKTLSLHTFEDDDLRVSADFSLRVRWPLTPPLVPVQGGLLYNHHWPVLRVDPEQRCAAMLVFGTHLAILPFRHGANLDETEPSSPILQKYMYSCTRS